MTDNEFKQIMESHGVRLMHIGMIVQDREAAEAAISWLPYFGDWYNRREVTWEKETTTKGAPHKIRIAQNDIMSGLPIELVQPVARKCENTYFDKYFEQEQEGLHHIAYTCPTYESYCLMIERAKEKGYVPVQNTRGIQKREADEYEVEFTYLKAPKSGIYIEVSWRN